MLPQLPWKREVSINHSIGDSEKELPRNSPEVQGATLNLCCQGVAPFAPIGMCTHAVLLGDSRRLCVVELQRGRDSIIKRQQASVRESGYVHDVISEG